VKNEQPGSRKGQALGVAFQRTPMLSQPALGCGPKEVTQGGQLKGSSKRSTKSYIYQVTAICWRSTSPSRALNGQRGSAYLLPAGAQSRSCPDPQPRRPEQSSELPLLRDPATAASAGLQGGAGSFRITTDCTQRSGASCPGFLIGRSNCEEGSAPHARVGRRCLAPDCLQT
jgi:hypothetical protein